MRNFNLYPLLHSCEYCVLIHLLHSNIRILYIIIYPLSRLIIRQYTRKENYSCVKVEYCNNTITRQSQSSWDM